MTDLRHQKRLKSLEQMTAELQLRVKVLEASVHPAIYRGDPGFETECEDAQSESCFWSPDYQDRGNTSGENRREN